jgi:holin-like protein|tara:strand:+ start:3353 stop:3721 length:369 start_codon:yes stop_codon:yes gene_type:complete
MLRGFITLLVFQGIGESIVYFGHLPIPGPVIGMVLLFLALQAKNQGAPASLEDIAHLMIRYLYLFLIPACVGCFFLIKNNLEEWIIIIISVVVSTLVSMIFGALMMKYMLTRHQKKPEEDSQ